MILVRHILEDARKRLAVLDQESLVVVVRDNDGVTVGVITKSNIITALARAKGDATGLTVGRN